MSCGPAHCLDKTWECRKLYLIKYFNYYPENLAKSERDNSVQKATSRRTRAHNTKLVLKTIYSDGPISRAQIARVTKLTPPTVSTVVARLMKEGLLDEVGYAPSSGGRRALLLSVADESRQIMGLDLSRQDFRGALTDLRCNIKQRSNIPLQGRDGEAALSVVYDLVGTLLDQGSRPVLGIGIGAPGLVDAAGGVIQQSVNLNWRHIPLRDLLAERFHLPVHMANDCQVAAMAVYTFSDRVENHLPLVVINLGWGVGAGIVINGHLMHGSPMGAGEIGHIMVAEDGFQCACGHRGCLETVASSRWVVDRVRAHFGKQSSNSITTQITVQGDIEFEDVLQAFNEGNEFVRDVILDAGRSLGIAASYLTGVLGSCRILISGHMQQFGQFLIDAMQEEMSRRTLPSLARNTELGIANAGSDIVTLGATALILHHELGVL